LSAKTKISAGAKAEAKMIEVFGSLVWGGEKIIGFH
jgi:flagellar biosynthesis component FlhA